MTSLLELREYIKNFYTKYELYITYLWKFLLSLIAFTMIGNKIGYQTNLTKLPILLMAALLCSIMPSNFMVLVSAGFILAHLYKLSIQCAVVGLIMFLLMFLLYFRFSPKDTLAVMLTPMCFYLSIPYVMPIALGLLGSPASIISMAFGVIVAFFVNYISDNATTLTGAEIEDSATQFQSIISELMNNKRMWVFVAAFAITVAVVYLIRRMAVDHAWTIAIIAGALTDIICLLVGDMMYTTQLSFIGVIVQSIIAILLLMILQFFAFNLDYTRIEKVQFEDDEYYYYVKAVPKVTVSTPAPKVKKISGSNAGRDYRGKDRGE
ncbi:MULTISPECIES: hypothetical protein [unclassified Butyrivibrio]|uniref:hypothetical protein n=2 Tax=unclassified Butyrivibrio TaxID=2639466 RepID=UPI0005D27648|nr:MULTISPECIES: hypothetical protein [unclassified Butyrivibrio]